MRIDIDRGINAVILIELFKSNRLLDLNEAEHMWRCLPISDQKAALEFYEKAKAMAH